MAKVQFPEIKKGSRNLYHGDTDVAETNELRASINDLYDEVEAQAASGSAVSFDKRYHYGNPASPVTGNITFNFTGAILGMRQLMVHNDSVAPTLPAEAQVLSGTYSLGTDNYIEFIYYASGKVLVTYL